MPFTFSHPALILPFLKFEKKYFSTTGLIVGSMIPDVEYYLKLEKTTSVYSHSISGIFWFNLPIALFVCFIFHKIIRNPLIHHAPAYFNRRFGPYLNFSWRRFFRAHPFLVVISIVVGSGTHIAADRFLHYLFDGSYVNTDVMIGSFMIEATAYEKAHFISSAVLLLFVFLYLHFLPRWRQYRRNINKYYLPSLIIFTVIGIYLITLKKNVESFEDGLVMSISAIALALFITSLIVFLQKKFSD